MKGGMSANTVVTETRAVEEVGRVQRRAFGVVLMVQIIGGFGGEMGAAVGGLLIIRMSGTPSLSGLSYCVMMIGSSLLALPAAWIMARGGRRPGLVMTYVCAATGASIIVCATRFGSVPLALAGMLLFGGVTVANFQSRYAAVDLSKPTARGRRLSVLVWGMALGAVIGPNFAATADEQAQRVHLPAMAGPFAMSAVVFVAGAVLVWSLLRPDPLLLARAIAEEARQGDVVAPKANLMAALRTVRSLPAACMGIASTAVGHLVTIGVMAMTPVYLEIVLAGERASNDQVLRTSGFVLALSIAGAYGAAPLAGWLADRWGRYPVISAGAVLLLAACALAGTADTRTERLAIGLTLLGLGWCCTVVAGSALLADSVPVETRPLAQGTSDLIMCLSGAIAAAVGGLVVGYAGFPVFTALLAATIAFLPVLGFRMKRSRSAKEG